MDYIAQPKDYWIAQNAINITLNALGSPNRTQGSVASGAAILCYIEGIDGLGYDNGHRFRTWPLSISPTKFNSNTEKYVYAAIPRSASVGTQAIVVFPSEKLDIYGHNANDEQVGSTDYYYIWLQGILTATDGTAEREWAPMMDFGKKGTDEDLYDDTSSDWYMYSKVNEVVTLLKPIIMKAGSYFHNLILGNKELTGVATSDIAYTDSDTLVATPGYVESQYLSKTHEDTAAAKITFREGLDAKHIRVTGSNGTTPDVDNITQKEVGLEVEQSGVIGGIFRVAKSILTKTVQSLNFSGGDSLTGTGWQLTDDYGTGRSRLVVDDAVFRGKVTLNELEVRKLMAMGGNYVFSPAASIIEQVDYYGYILTPGEQEPTIGLLGYEYVKVPWVLRLIPLSLRGRYLSKKKWVRSTMSQEDYSRVVFYRCWLKADDGSTQTINTWKEGMLARCQTFDTSQIENGDHSGKYNSPDSGLHGKDVTNKLYWRAVTATAQGVDKNNYQGKSAVLDDGRKHNYIDLSNGWQDDVQLYLSGSDHVSAGDHIVCYGDWKDVNLSHFVTIETIGDDAPAVKEFRGVGYTDGTGIDWSLNNKCKTKISPVAGNDFYSPHFYVETEGSVRDVATFMVSTDGILAEVKQGLQRTGIDITNGIINLIANKTLFKTSDEVPMIAVQMADANGNVGTGPTYTIPSIVFYDGEINNGGQVRWVLNYRGLIEALSNTHDYKMTPVEGYLSFFNLGNNDNPNRAGMNIEEAFTPAMLAKEDYPRSVRVGGNNYYHEVFYLFTSGYQIINGNLIYIPSNGPDYENIYWQTQGLTDDKRPDYNLEEHITGTNAPANGYYVKIVERKRNGNEDDTSGGQISFAQYDVTYEIYELVNGAVNETGIRFYLSYNGRKIESPLHYYETYGAEITVNDVLYYENDELKLKNILGIE